jgi:hypothetical protein
MLFVKTILLDSCFFMICKHSAVYVICDNSGLGWLLYTHYEDVRVLAERLTMEAAMNQFIIHLGNDSATMWKAVKKDSMFKVKLRQCRQPTHC